jgi:hypothetical protein
MDFKRDVKALVTTNAQFKQKPRGVMLKIS